MGPSLVGFDRLEFRLLGELSILHDGVPVPLPSSKKTRALLAYLLLTGRSHTRERLCELFWEAPDDPRASLRWSLWKLRPLVDHPRTERLATTRETVAFLPHGAIVDVTEVRALAGALERATTEELTRAATRFRGELLEGLDLPAAFRFQEWCAAEREGLRAMQLRILDELVTRLDGEEALLFARARVAVDPLDDSGQAALIRLLGRLGRAREALAQYDACRRLLASELGAAPSASLEEARRGLLVPPSPAATTAPAEKVTSRLPLVGRSDALAVLERVVAERRIAFVIGEPGIGKTRLVDELEVHATAAGRRVMRAAAWEPERSRAYGPFIDALRALGAPPDDLRQALAELGFGPPTGAPASGDRARLWTALSEWLRREDPLVILDDVQWLDDESAALLHHLGRSPHQLPLILAARPGELADNRAALRTVRALVRGGRVEELRLVPLDERAHGELVRAVRPDADAAHLFVESEGNPLYALTLAQTSPGGRLPATLEELLADRLEELDPSARELAAWIAVFGRGATVRALGEASGTPPFELTAALERLESRGVLRAGDGGERWEFTHDLLRRVAYQRTSAPRRRLIHLHIARALERLGDHDDAWSDAIARHAAEGGDALLCAQACLRAGQRSLRLYAYVDAEMFSQLGLRQAESLPRQTRVPLQIALVALVVHPAVRLRKPGALSGELTRLAAEAGELGLRSDESRALVQLARLHYHAWSDMPRARAALSQAVTLLERTAAANLEPLLSAARCLALIHAEMPRVAALFDELALLGPTVVDNLYYQWGAGLVLRWRGDTDGSGRSLERAATLARARGDHWAEFECTSALASLELERGDGGPAARELVAIAGRLSAGGSERATAAAFVALAHLQAGAEHAAVELDAALRELDALGATALVAEVHSMAANLLLARSDTRAARTHAERALAVARRAHQPVELGRALVVLSRVDNVEGRSDDAARRLAEARPLAVDLPAGLRAIVGGCPS